MIKSKKWIMPEIDKSAVRCISKEFGLPELVSRILCARGFCCNDELKEFLSKNPNSFYDPFLLNDMEKAVKTIKSALKDGLKIAVYGDYDVDGITSTYIVYDYLNSLGADVIYYIPDRITEGYGMNKSAIDSLKAKNVGLIITVDVGITAVEETAYAQQNGMEVIITDHHTLKETLPSAAAVVNPKIKESGYPFDALAGVGVAFKLVYALSDCDNNIFNKYCDIAAIGTIADMVPLSGENRYIASVGIEKLKSTNNLGIRALMETAGKNIAEADSSDISFLIAPRLNAAGRISNASMSIELLLEKNPEKAVLQAQRLDECNKLRQKEEQKILDEALEIIKSNSYENDSFIVVAKENWMHGVIGIVSSKITEMFYKPSSVISINPDGTGKASGRSIKGINLFNALCKCKDNLIKFGGHELAAGFTVREGMIDSFRKDMNSNIEPIMTDDIAAPSLLVDAVVKLDEISVKTVEDLKILEPYGVGNIAPLLCINDVTIKSIRYSSNKKHAFLSVFSDNRTLEVSAFSLVDTVSRFKPGDTVSLVGYLTLNTFRGNCEPQFAAKDIHESELAKFVSRAELACIFNIIRSEMENGLISLCKANLLPHDKSAGLELFKRPKIETALKIFEELGILNIESSGGTLLLSRGTNFKSKNNLTDSKTFIKYQKHCS